MMNNFVIQIDEEAFKVFKEVDGCTGLGWYFWDETETHLFGPFLTPERAEIALNVYSGCI